MGISPWLLALASLASRQADPSRAKGANTERNRNTARAEVWWWGASDGAYLKALLVLFLLSLGVRASIK